jgi:Zn finger protein HypA/HybF involved in hydrogenase expression
MEIKLKIKKMGTGHVVFVPKLVMDSLLLKAEDEIVLDIRKVEKDTSTIRTYKCKLCGHRFSSDDEHPYCPSCDNNRLEVVYE